MTNLSVNTLVHANDDDGDDDAHVNENAQLNFIQLHAA